MSNTVARHGRPDIATAKPGWRRTRQRITLLPWLDEEALLTGRRYRLGWMKAKGRFFQVS